MLNSWNQHYAELRVLQHPWKFSDWGNGKAHRNSRSGKPIEWHVILFQLWLIKEPFPHLDHRNLSELDSSARKEEWKRTKKTGLDNIFRLSVNSTPCVLPTLYSPMLDLDWTKVLVVFSALRFPNGKRTNNCVFDPGHQDSIFFIGLQRRKQHVRKHLCSRGGEIITLVSTFF